MKIGFFGDGPWALQALQFLLDDPGLDPVFVVGRHEVPCRKLNTLVAQSGLPFASPEKVNRSDFIEWTKDFDADLFVSMSYDQIIKSDLRQAAPKGFINCHAGALPYYRGRNVLNWALINGESRFGVTVHHIDDGIDTGDIIRQDFVDIRPDDDYGTILNEAYGACAKSLYRAIVDLAGGRASRTPQSEISPAGFYCGRRRPGDEWIDWSWTSARLHNFIRGIAPPGPGARTWDGEREIALLGSSLIAGAPDYIGHPGEIVGKNENGIILKTFDNTIHIGRMAVADEFGELTHKQPQEFRIGHRFSRHASPGHHVGKPTKVNNSA